MATVEEEGRSLESVIDMALGVIEKGLQDSDTPAHVLGRYTATLAQLAKLKAKDGGADAEPVDSDLGPALAALPAERATEILVEEIKRLESASVGYRQQLIDLVGPAVAAEALGDAG